MDPGARWDSFEREKRYGNPALPDPTLLDQARIGGPDLRGRNRTSHPTNLNTNWVPPEQSYGQWSGCPVLRIRKEPNADDAINSRAWDFFHATPPTQVSSSNLQRNPPAYWDMNPITSRTDKTKFRLQPEYIPDPKRATTTADMLGNAPPPGPIYIPPAKMSLNPYMQRLDTQGEGSRNVMRELRAAVYEDNRDVDVDTDRSLVERQFTDRYLPPKTALDIQSLQAYELLKPKQDDYRQTIRFEEKSPGL